MGIFKFAIQQVVAIGRSPAPLETPEPVKNIGRSTGIELIKTYAFQHRWAVGCVGIYFFSYFYALGLRFQSQANSN